MENNKTPNEVTRAIAGLKKDLTSTSTISSKKLAERTLTYLEESIAHIHKNKPETNLKSLLKLVQEHSDALQVAASRIVKDDSGTFKVIIKNLTMRILKILRSDLGDDEGEDLYGKVVKFVVKKKASENERIIFKHVSYFFSCFHTHLLNLKHDILPT